MVKIDIKQLWSILYTFFFSPVKKVNTMEKTGQEDQMFLQDVMLLWCANSPRVYKEAGQTGSEACTPTPATS